MSKWISILLVYCFGLCFFSAQLVAEHSELNPANYPILSVKQFYDLSDGDFVIEKESQDLQESEFYNQHRDAHIYCEPDFLGKDGITYDQYLLYLRTKIGYQPTDHQLDSAKIYRRLIDVIFNDDGSFRGNLEYRTMSYADYRDVPLVRFEPYNKRIYYQQYSFPCSVCNGGIDISELKIKSFIGHNWVFPWGLLGEVRYFSNNDVVKFDSDGLLRQALFPRWTDIEPGFPIPADVKHPNEDWIIENSSHLHGVNIEYFKIYGVPVMGLTTFNTDGTIKETNMVHEGYLQDRKLYNAVEFQVILHELHELQGLKLRKEFGLIKRNETIDWDVLDDSMRLLQTALAAYGVRREALY